MIEVVRDSLRYSIGVTLMATEGGAGKAYVKTYKDGLDPVYLLTAPNTNDGALE